MFLDRRERPVGARQALIPSRPSVRYGSAGAVGGARQRPVRDSYLAHV